MLNTGSSPLSFCAMHSLHFWHLHSLQRRLCSTAALPSWSFPLLPSLLIEEQEGLQACCRAVQFASHGTMPANIRTAIRRLPEDRVRGANFCHDCLDMLFVGIVNVHRGTDRRCVDLSKEFTLLRVRDRGHTRRSQKCFQISGYTQGHTREPDPTHLKLKHKTTR